ncbi:MAG: hypothetical protein ACXVFU_02950 [Nocardioidaceae bacterium]
MPCPECGASVDRTAADPHVCDPERRAAYELIPLRDEIDSFESRMHEYLDSDAGQFESWLAARHVRASR